MTRSRGILTICSVTLCFVMLPRSQAQSCNPIYVSVAAPDPCTNCGQDWANAYPSLQDALLQARGGGVTHVFVAHGTYLPDHGTGIVEGDRWASFDLVEGVEVYGGFAGTETILDCDVSVRTLSGPPSILSGQLESAHSYHIVKAGSTISNGTILDGFTIKAGKADGADVDSYGGGMLIEDSSPVIRNCTFTENEALHGGAVVVRNAASSPVFEDCIFSYNLAKTGGEGGAIRFFNCEEPRNCGDDGDVCTYYACCGEQCMLKNNKFGDVDHNQSVNLFDLFCLLDAFSDIFDRCTFYDVDIDPCEGNGSINLQDQFAILNAFSDIDPCDCGGETEGCTSAKIARLAASPPPSSSVNADLTFEVQAAVESVSPGELFEIDVFGKNFNDIRAFEIGLDVSGGTTGSLRIENIVVRETRNDFAFKGHTYEHRVSAAKERILGALIYTKESSAGPKYLATFQLRASQKASGTFMVGVSTANTLVGTAIDRVTGVKAGNSVQITVSGS